MNPSAETHKRMVGFFGFQRRHVMGKDEIVFKGFFLTLLLLLSFSWKIETRPELKPHAICVELWLYRRVKHSS
jgi:hypothetical protein